MTDTGARLPSIALRGACHAFDGRLVLGGVDLDVAAGGRVAIVGPSGCGKSTLLRQVAGLLEPTAGTVDVGGARTGPERLRRCALMPQKDLLLPWRTALDNAALPLVVAGLGAARARREARPLLARFGLEQFERHRPAELSGGMRQRVAFVRTLLTRRDVLLLDEPFGALDAITRAALQDWLLAALASEPRTVVLVTHDVEEAILLADRVIVLSPAPGRVVLELDCRLPERRTRRELVTSVAFSALREQALEALEC